MIPIPEENKPISSQDFQDFIGNLRSSYGSCDFWFLESHFKFVPRLDKEKLVIVLLHYDGLEGDEGHFESVEDSVSYDLSSKEIKWGKIIKPKHIRKLMQKAKEEHDHGDRWLSISKGNRILNEMMGM